VVITNTQGAVTSTVVAVTVVAQSGSSGGGARVWYRLGDGDPGASPGKLANAFTVDEAGANNLSRAGSPAYSSDVWTNGDSLAMAFNPATSDWFTGSVLLIFSTLNLSNFSLSFDVKPTAAAGYNIPICFGRYGSGASFIYMAGGTWRYHVGGVGDQISGGVAALDEWQHLAFTRSNGVNALLVNGVQVGVTGNTLFPTPSADFSIGAACNGAGNPDGLFAGLIDNVKITDLTAGESIQRPVLALRVSGDQAMVEVAGSPGFLHTLWRTIALSPANWLAITNGVTNANGQTALIDASPPASGAFYRVSVM
jgi:hypothetical protein